jgi:hypothetical protein
VLRLSLASGIIVIELACAHAPRQVERARTVEVPEMSSPATAEPPLATSTVTTIAWEGDDGELAPLKSAIETRGTLLASCLPMEHPGPDFDTRFVIFFPFFGSERVESVVGVLSEDCVRRSVRDALRDKVVSETVLRDFKVRLNGRVNVILRVHPSPQRARVERENVEARVQMFCDAVDDEARARPEDAPLWVDRAAERVSAAPPPSQATYLAQQLEGVFQALTAIAPEDQETMIEAAFSDLGLGAVCPRSAAYATFRALPENERSEPREER